MKGVSTEVIIFSLLAIAIVVLAIFFLSGRLGPGSTQLTKEECRNKVLSACSSYRITGTNNAFKNIPTTCADILGISNNFRNCISPSGTLQYDPCKVVCDEIEGIRSE